MPEFYSEPYLSLAGLTHKSALIAWGAFYFKVKRNGELKLVDDSDLDDVNPPRHESIGARSQPYGKVRVEVYDSSGATVASAETITKNHCWLTGLSPDTEYTYKVFLLKRNGEEEWGRGERRDWVIDNGDRKGLKHVGNHYENRFRTHPHPMQPATGPLTFAVIGDFGVGIKKPSTETRRQREVAEALRKAVDEYGVRLILTTGDNIYAGRKFLGIPIGAQGDEDDDWFFTYYQPYRYVINRVPVYPCIGNHDAGETEEKDDRDQLIDNLYINERFAGEEAEGRASIGPGLFYRFCYGSEIEFVCLDSSKEDFFHDRLVEHQNHLRFINSAFPDLRGVAPQSPRWRIPFAHHPPFCAGPQHHNTKAMVKLVPLFQRAGVRAVFSGHEHNFQHSQHEGIEYFISGAGGKLRPGTPDRFDAAHTVSWCPSHHLLLVTIDGNKMQIRPIAPLASRTDDLTEIQRLNPQGEPVNTPILITQPAE